MIAIEDGKAKIASYAARYPQFTDLSKYANAFYDEQQKEATIAAMREHFRNNDIDKALEVAQGM